MNHVSLVKKRGKVALERALSKLGIASRSATRIAILEGRLSVNGKVVRDPQALVTLETDVFKLDGKRVSATATCTIMMNKPKGYVTTKSDEKGRKTVYDLLPEQLKHLHPVGRLDMHTTGLLLLTTDTDLSAHLTDPANAIEREYVVTVKGLVTDDEITRLHNGIKDAGELLKARQIILRKSSNRESHLLVTLVQGKNREIRRMFDAIGHEVTALKRIRFGLIELKDLLNGTYKILTVMEIENLRNSKGDCGPDNLRRRVRNTAL